YGFINTCLKSLVVEKYGEEIWENLRYSPNWNVSPDMVLKQFGEYFFEFCKQSGYDHMLRTLGGNLYEFIENLDALHSYLSLSYQARIIGAAALDFFNTEISMEIVNQTEEEERTGKKEHIVFLVTQKPELERTMNKIRDKTSRLLKGFDPVYPRTLWIDPKTFCIGLPFHIVFDEQLRVKQAGVSIQKIVPGLQILGIHLNQYFTIVRPEVKFTISSVQRFINSQFIFQTKREMMPASWKQRPMLELRGQMIWMESVQCMLYLCSPLLRTLHELEERHMHISDIAPHDVTRDLILLNQQRLAEMELSNQLERKKEELRILSKHLEEEKKKTEALLYAMLPKHVANQLKEGKRVEAGEFKECTILFSDVVTFTNICAQCEPIQIVLMLNAMYLRFDRLTTVHDVYKVETIGDAYMVVGGVPVPVSTHAERVANFALGMIIAAKEIKNPIRVGIHTGSVLAGVVGEKMPRYCLFGDTVNIASRMESHGVPNKIHLSGSVYQCLKEKNFDIKERGEIDVKGKGKMHTYFLVQNTIATENEIMGRPSEDADLNHESSQLSQDCTADGMQNSFSQDIPLNSDKELPPIVAMKYADRPIENHTNVKGRHESRTKDLT
ncbi:Guanylate cyclase soluble subunit beta-2, partial [Ophiophagus hannah]